MPFDPTRVQAVFFDLDGTLIDTDDDYIRRVARLIRPLHFLFPRRDPTRFLRWGLMTIESPLNTLMGVPDWLGFDRQLIGALNWLTDLRGRPRQHHFSLIAGVPELLARLAARYPLAAITARSERTTRAMLETMQLQPYFRLAVHAQSAAHAKPYPDPVHLAARSLGVPVADCLMVGDTTVDILAGRRAGAQTAGVLCGFGERAELQRAGADLILPTTADLGDVLNK